MHGGWYASGMGALGASSGLQSGFSSGGLGGGVVPHSQSYHLMVRKLTIIIFYSRFDISLKKFHFQPLLGFIFLESNQVFLIFLSFRSNQSGCNMGT